MMSPLRMLVTFNQHLPMILSNNYRCKIKPTSFALRYMGPVQEVLRHDKPIKNVGHFQSTSTNDPFQ